MILRACVTTSDDFSCSALHMEQSRPLPLLLLCCCSTSMTPNYMSITLKHGRVMDGRESCVVTGPDAVLKYSDIWMLHENGVI